MPPTTVLSHPNEEQFVQLNGDVIVLALAVQAAALGPAYTQALREQVERQTAAAQKRDP